MSAQSSSDATRASWAVHVAVLFLVTIWTLPTAGLLISSFRDKDQLAVSGWWTALSSSTQNLQGRTAPSTDQVQRDGVWVIEGNLLGEGASGQITAFGTSPEIPIELRTTMIIGAIARIGTIWLPITQGITLASAVRSWTIPTASRIPSPAPSPKPASVAASVTQAW